jgi:hypothetical protein
MATCRPTLFLLTMKEILLVHFIITNFRVAHKMLCTPWLRNPLTISRLFASAAKRPFFSLGSSKYDFASLIYKILLQPTGHTYRVIQIGIRAPISFLF